MLESNNLFKKSVELLDHHNINYWVCHGTLLGIIRDKNLLAWDHDIDFAVWEDEYSKEDMLKIFSRKLGYKQETSIEEVNSLHFATINKRLDINFYTRDKNKSFIKWAVPKNRTSNNYNLKKFFHFAIIFLVKNVSIRESIKSSNGIIFSIIKFLVTIPLILIRYLLSNNIKKKLLKEAYKKFDIMGYSYPLSLMEFKKIEFMGIKIRIPKKPEEVLKFTYGNDRKIPKKNFVWYKEGRNLYRQDKNITKE